MRSEPTRSSQESARSAKKAATMRAGGSGFGGMTATLAAEGRRKSTKKKATFEKKK